MSAFHFLKMSNESDTLFDKQWLTDYFDCGVLRNDLLLGF